MSVFEYAVCLLAIMLKDKQTISKQMIPIMKMKFEGRAIPIAFASQYMGAGNKAQSVMTIARNIHSSE